MAFLPTFMYPRIKYGTPSIVIDIPDALQTVTPLSGVVSSSKISSNGTKETLFIRRESLAQFVLQWLQPWTLARLKEFFDTHAGKGKQFEFWLDRFTGSRWDFADSLKDQNGQALIVVGAEAYNDSTQGRAFDFVAGNELSVIATDGVHLAKEEGCITLRVKPDWAGNDGVLHYFIDIGVGASANRLAIYKTVANDLVFEVINAGGTSRKRQVAVSWSSNTEQRITVRWKTNGTLDLWLNGVQATTSSGTGGVVTVLGPTLNIGSDLSQANKATGDYDLVAFYMRAFDDPLVLENNPIETRSYFSKAELEDKQFLPVRQARAVQRSTLTLTIRQGK